MKNPRQSRLDRYYDLYTENKTSFEKKLERITNDPIRYYEGTNEKVSNFSIKAVKLG